MRTQDYAGQAVLKAKTEHWLATIRNTVAPRPHLEPHVPSCVLLVVDMLRYFVSPEGRSYLPAATPIVPNVVALIRAWRRTGGPVVFTRHCHEGPHDLGMLGKFFSDYIRCGEPDSALVPGVEPREDEPVFRKTTYDAFLGTGLEDHLRSRGVSQVLVTGVLTHMCVETTARSAFCRGFEVFVAADATASSRETFHLHALMSMADSVAVVFGTEEILEKVGGTGRALGAKSG